MSRHKTLHNEIPIPKPFIDNLQYIGNPFKEISVKLPAELSVIENIDTDLEYGLKFLYSYNGSNSTFNGYRSEIERLFQWAWLIEKRSITTLMRSDIEEYIEFCKSPPSHWISYKTVARFKKINGQRVINPEWRPFVVKISKAEFKAGKPVENKPYVLTQGSVKSIFTVISSFYSFLVQESVTEFNPVSLIRQKSKFVQKEARPEVRRISNLQWEYVIESATLLADNNPKDHERTLFIMNALYAMYLRISELVADDRSTPMMHDFRRDHDSNYWFHVLGKGNKNRIVTVSDEMLCALKRYRISRNLPSLPVPGEYEPLILNSYGKGPIKSSRQIRNIVQGCFNYAYQRMVEDGLTDDANELQAATVHWLRHTGISEDVKHRPREHVRDDAGHASMATTDRYVDSDLRERHQSGKRKQIKDIY